MTNTIISQIDVLTVRNSVRASLPNPGLSNSTSRLPFVTRLAQPLTMNDIASVAISALMRSTVVMRPLARPISRPAPMPSSHREDGIRLEREVRRDDARQRVDRAHREVDAARDEHERPGRGDDQDRRLLVEDVEQVRLRRERGARQRQDGEEDDERERMPDACAARAATGLPGSSSPSTVLARAHAATPPDGSSAKAAARIALARHGLAGELGDDPAAPHDEHAMGRGRGSPRARTRSG